MVPPGGRELAAAYLLPFEEARALRPELQRMTDAVFARGEATEGRSRAVVWSDLATLTECCLFLEKSPILLHLDRSFVARAG
jgi:hypothetical protein